uniref:MOSC domain-containing protein n=1 Tax=Bionectria ochroleuca TaxID=29856 RepID=A0A8H7NNF0_BIOOC
MKVVALWVYPIKGLRGIRLECADLGPQGIKHDRNFMLCRVEEGEEPLKLQLSRFPQCALFSQEIVGDSIQVRYNVPEEPLVPPCPEQAEVLEVPLGPDITQLRKEEVNLHQSKVNAYRMGDRYDAWFTACFGFPTALFYIGDERRPILGTFSPDSEPTPRPKGWLAALSDYMAPGTTTTAGEEPKWLTFSDCAPFLITTGASLANVSARLAAGDMEMAKFRPNIVLDGDKEWDEDFWTRLTLNGRPAFTLTKMCVRCTSVNVDYDTGRPARASAGRSSRSSWRTGGWTGAQNTPRSLASTRSSTGTYHRTPQSPSEMTCRSRGGARNDPSSTGPSTRRKPPDSTRTRCNARGSCATDGRPGSLPGGRGKLKLPQWHVGWAPPRFALLALGSNH